MPIWEPFLGPKSLPAWLVGAQVTNLEHRGSAASPDFCFFLWYSQNTKMGKKHDLRRNSVAHVTTKDQTLSLKKDCLVADLTSPETPGLLVSFCVVSDPSWLSPETPVLWANVGAKGPGRTFGNTSSRANSLSAWAQETPSPSAQARVLHGNSLAECSDSSALRESPLTKVSQQRRKKDGLEVAEPHVWMGVSFWSRGCLWAPWGRSR